MTVFNSTILDLLGSNGFNRHVLLVDNAISVASASHSTISNSILDNGTSCNVSTLDAERGNLRRPDGVVDKLGGVDGSVSNQISGNYWNLIKNVFVRNGIGIQRPVGNCTVSEGSVQDRSTTEGGSRYRLWAELVAGDSKASKIFFRNTKVTDLGGCNGTVKQLRFLNGIFGEPVIANGTFFERGETVVAKSADNIILTDTTICNLGGFDGAVWDRLHGLLSVVGASNSTFPDHVTGNRAIGKSRSYHSSFLQIELLDSHVDEVVRGDCGAGQNVTGDGLCGDVICTDGTRCNVCTRNGSRHNFCPRDAAISDNIARNSRCTDLGVADGLVNNIRPTNCTVSELGSGYNTVFKVKRVNCTITNVDVLDSAINQGSSRDSVVGEIASDDASTGFQVSGNNRGRHDFVAGHGTWSKIFRSDTSASDFDIGNGVVCYGACFDLAVLDHVTTNNVFTEAKLTQQ
mmetsp:Transcript_4496/g.8541  ORF Transcript_4496/g.8541 Transcript_4496/m.8541 type:complete len:460 (-) Transcript_4496:1856-3235(-)